MSYKCDFVFCQCELNCCYFIMYNPKWFTHTLYFSKHCYNFSHF